ncbi:RhuM family protein [Yoonia sp.]|uniref:RhuM family protein n=1 Tax=Yoonia sp. TaxID=2212373 RepID=UPI00358E4010
MSDQSDAPVQLVEDETTGDRFLVYGTVKGMRLDIRYEGDTLWMTQAQIAELFGRDRSVVTKHLANIFADGELEEESNVQKMHIAHSAKPISIYSLDVIISVGYRVSSKQATVFRKWATQTLVQFAAKGFVVDKVRLKQPESADRVRELREIIRDIRSDEANMYAELKDICAMCQDYQAGSTQSLRFYQHTQAKLVYAVTSNTPSEILSRRSDSAQPNMGLQTWPNDNIRKSDVVVSKNYLTETELRELNRLTDILLSIFEDQLALGRLATMSDAENMLAARLRDLGRVVLNDGGTVDANVAKSRAIQQYEMFKEKQKVKKKAVADEEIRALREAAKGLPKGRKT